MAATMSTKAKSLAGLLVIVVAVGTYVFVSNPLPRFARRIASADHVVASMKQGAVSITIAGEDATRLVQAVSSAKRERPPWGMEDACIYDVRIAFYEGTKPLGDILSCTRLFIVSGKKYRDDTGLLGALAVHPIQNAYVEWGRKHMESK
jgi:hypothetical protein